MNTTHISQDFQCLRDHFLIAMPSLRDGLFAQAVTYLCEHNPEGAMGLVINQPIDLRLPPLLRQLEMEPRPDVPNEPIFRGGPVNPENGFVLHSADQHWRGTRQLTEELALTTSRDILEAIANGEVPQRLLVALGYAGWGPGQLEEELAANSWLVAPMDPAILFSLPPEQRWSAAARLIGVDVHLISSVTGHA